MNPFILFGNFKDFWVNVKCIHRVADEVMDGSDVDDLWYDAKIKIKAIVDVEWRNCLNMGDSVEQEKCARKIKFITIIIVIIITIIIIICCFENV